MIRPICRALIFAIIITAALGFLWIWPRGYDINENMTPGTNTSTVTEKTEPTRWTKADGIPEKSLKEVTIPILCYHRFEDVPLSRYAITPTVFEDQMEYLRRNGFHSISLESLSDYICGSLNSLPPKPIVISIDDGWKSGSTRALPILIKKGFTAVFFVYTDFISSCPNSLSWEDLKGLLKQNFEVGCHTKSHPHFLFLRKKLDSHEYQGRILEELGDSKRLLEKKLGTSVTLFSYPYGIYDSSLENLVRKYGYKIAVSTNPCPNSKKSNNLRLSRFIILRSHTQEDFARIVASRLLLAVGLKPHDFSTVETSQPIISVRIVDKNIDMSSLKMELGETTLPATFDPTTNQFSYQVTENLKNTAYIVTISAKERTTGRMKFASWLFIVDAPT